MKLKSFLSVVVLFLVCIGMWGCTTGITHVTGNPPPDPEYEKTRPIEGTGLATVEVYRNYLAYTHGERPIHKYYVKKDPRTGNYYRASQNKNGEWVLTEEGEEQRRKDAIRLGIEAEYSSDWGWCTHLYLVDENGKERFLGYTLSAIGVDNERWESLKITVPVKDTITIRLVKEMPNEITFIDQVKIRVVETDPKGRTIQYYLKGSEATKDGESGNRLTAFRNDGNHIPISSSKIPDPSSEWGVARGECLELNFVVPPLHNGHVREYYVMTLGYYIKEQ